MIGWSGEPLRRGRDAGGGGQGGHGTGVIDLSHVSQ